jgi:hypothetical protein
MSFREVALWFIRPFPLIGLFGRLENLICETLESVIVPGLVLCLGMENTYSIKEGFKFTWLGPVLLFASWSFHCVDRIIYLPLPVVALG